YQEKMKIYRIIILSVIFFSSTWVGAQNNLSFHEQMVFSDYLIKNNFYYDCKTFVNYYLNDPSLTNNQKDSLYYFAGKVYFASEIFDTASVYFSKVSGNSALHKEAAFYSSFCLAEDHCYDESKISFSSLASSEKFYNEFLNFEQYGAKLLARDTSGCSSLKNTFTYSDKNFAVEESKLILIEHDIILMKKMHKSGLLAGCMSAVIPGLGKIYAGKTKQGLSSFLPVTLLGVQAYEAYRKTGVKSARFILSAGLFSVFYIGNIWGSVLSVSVNRTEIHDEINNQILFHMRIPFQRISGKN
ncbi:MAG: hypothetical protein V1904_02205, partial [Bacteroidota bacterium]